MIAYQNDFKLLMLFTLITMPFVLLIGSSRTRRTAAAAPARVISAHCRSGSACSSRHARAEAYRSSREPPHPDAIARQVGNAPNVFAPNSARIFSLCSPSAGTGP